MYSINQNSCVQAFLLAFVGFSLAHSSTILDEICARNVGPTKFVKKEYMLYNNQHQQRPKQVEHIHLRPLICFARDAIKGNITFFSITKEINMNATSQVFRFPYSSSPVFLLPFPFSYLLQYRPLPQEQLRPRPVVSTTPRVQPVQSTTAEPKVTKEPDASTISTSSKTSMETTSIETTVSSSSTETIMSPTSAETTMPFMSSAETTETSSTEAQATSTTETT